MFARVINKVFIERKYIAISVIGALLIIFLTAIFNNYRLIGSTGFGFVFNLVISLPVTLGLMQFIYVFVLSIVFGISVSLSIYHFKHSGLYSAKGIGSILISFLGIGCASCGSLILTPIFGVAAGGLLSTLPLHGTEFYFLGLGLLLWSTYSIAKKIDNPYVP